MLAIMNWGTSFFHSLFAFIIILVPLVVFHEFGHFVFAKIFGVKAEVFSVGFGPKLWSRQIGETELRISAIPMGGYVKLLGEDRESQISLEEQKRALHRQRPWKRFLIFFGGPLFNFILAVFIFMLILVIGEPQMASVVGRVVHKSAAEQAGFLSGDRIVAINGKPVSKFEDVILALNESPEKALIFSVNHAHSIKNVELNATPMRQLGYSIYGESTIVGEIEGLFPIPRGNHVGVSNPESPAGKGGIKTGDQILEVNQNLVLSWEDLEFFYQNLESRVPFLLKYQSGKSGTIQSIQMVKPELSRGLAEDLGLFSSELFVDRTVPHSPAEVAGVQSGDRLLGVGGQIVQSFFELKDAVQKSGEKDGKVQLKWERAGKIFSVVLTPTATVGRDPNLNKTTQYTVGVIPQLRMGEPVTVIERIWNPFQLVSLATQRMITFSWRNLVSLKKMVTGDVSVGSLGGPIMIGKIAGESLTRGLIVFLTNMAIFSVGLGVLNILPVPVLDGGHLMLLGVETIRGKPLSVRQMEVIQGFGLILILTLMGIAFRNDIARLFYS